MRGIGYRQPDSLDRFLLPNLSTPAHATSALSQAASLPPVDTGVTFQSLDGFVGGLAKKKQNGKRDVGWGWEWVGNPPVVMVLKRLLEEKTDL